MGLLNNPKFIEMMQENGWGSELPTMAEDEALDTMTIFNMGLLKRYGSQLNESEKENLQANLDSWSDVTDRLYGQWLAEKRGIEQDQGWLQTLWPDINFVPPAKERISKNEFSPMLAAEGINLREDELPPELQDALERHRANPFGMTKLDLVKAVNDYSNKHFEYVEDEKQFGREVMSHPREVLATQGADGKFRDDCDGLASVKAGFLKAMGFADNEITLVAARDRGDNEGHFVVAVNLPTGPVVMNYTLEKPGQDFYAADEPSLAFHPSLQGMTSIRGRE